eukprot:g9832.t1
MENLVSAAAGSPPGDGRLELHVRCVKGEDKTAVTLNLSDGSTVALNRSSDEDMSSTLRRLSLTVHKRRRLAESKAGAVVGGKAKGAKKRPKNDSGGGGRGGGGGGGKGGGGVSAGLFDKETGEPIEIHGVLNRDGWTRLCGGDQDSADGNGGSDDLNGSRSSSRHHGSTVVRIKPSVAAGADAGIASAPPAPPAAVLAAANAGSSTAGARAGEEGVLELDVVVNPPAVTSLECGVGLPMVGFSIVAQAEAEFETGMDWEWLREETEEKQQEGSEAAAAAIAMADKGATKKGQKKKTGQRSGSGSGGFSQVVGTLRAYTPRSEDVGRRLMIRCTPLGARGRRGRPVARVLTTRVRPGCEPALLALRRDWLEGRRRLEGGSGRVSGDDNRETRRLRVMCYNILADMYCTSEQADKVLYPYCPKEFRVLDYRMQMVTREIRGHAADLIMLQECDTKAYDRFLAPGLEFDGLKGIYLTKAGQEGEAIFYRSSVLTLEARHDFSMKDAIPAMEEFRGMLKAFPLLKAIVEERLTTVAQIAVFRPTSPTGTHGMSGRGGGDAYGQGEGPKYGKKEEEKGSSVRLIVANTHLYFHPNAAHIRLMQLVALVERVSRVRYDLIARGLRPAVVLGGDLNSVPFGPVRYLMGDVIGPDSELWNNVGTFKWGDRFFDEMAAAPADPESAAEATTAVTAAAAPSARDKDDATPPTGGTDHDNPGAQDEPTASATPNAPKRRPFLPGVPYLRVPLGLELVSGAPPFTNFTVEFTETLDYVFIEGGRADTRASNTSSSKSSGGGGGGDGGGGSPAELPENAVLRVEGEAAAAVAPMPKEGPLRAITPGLPSETFPSDHVSLVVDLVLSEVR